MSTSQWKGARIYHIRWFCWCRCCCCCCTGHIECATQEEPKKKTTNEQELKPFLNAKMECAHVWFVHLCHYLIDGSNELCPLEYYTLIPRMVNQTEHEAAYLTLKSMFCLQKPVKSIYKEFRTPPIAGCTFCGALEYHTFVRLVHLKLASFKSQPIATTCRLFFFALNHVSSWKNVAFLHACFSFAFVI